MSGAPAPGTLIACLWGMRSYAFVTILALVPLATARAQDQPMVLSPASGSVTVGQTFQLVVAPASASIRVTGPARLLDGGKLRVTGQGLIGITAVASGHTSAPVWLDSGSIANMPLGAPPPPPLVPGDRGADVKALQEFLNAALAAPGTQRIVPDGVFGPTTQAAIRAFQQANGLAPTGVGDGSTQQALAAAQSGGGSTQGTGSQVSVAGAGSGRSYKTGWHGAHTTVHQLADGALAYTGGMNIDADGAGSAWRGDRFGQNKTSLTDGNGRSLDPTKTPYVVLPIGFERAHPGVKLGDIVAVQYNGKTVFAIYGDRGPTTKIGEASILTAQELGIPASPTGGGVDAGVTYTVFPGSGTGQPLSNAEIARRGQAALDKLEGRTADEASPGLTGALNR